MLWLLLPGYELVASRLNRQPPVAEFVVLVQYRPIAPLLRAAEDWYSPEYTKLAGNLLKAFELEPESPKIISNLGYLALAQGDKTAARNYFTTVLEYDPKDKIAANELMKLEKSE